jgi:hypothetical protein
MFCKILKKRSELSVSLRKLHRFRKNNIPCVGFFIND